VYFVWILDFMRTLPVLRVTMNRLRKIQKKWRSLLHERVLWRLRDLSEGWRVSNSTRTVFMLAVYTLIVVYVALCSFLVLAYGGWQQCVCLIRRWWYGMALLLLCCKLLFAALTFDQQSSRLWLISSMLAFALDALVYNVVSILVTSILQLQFLISSETDGTTLPKTVGSIGSEVQRRLLRLWNL
jgi:hypothetical protein